MHIPQKDGSDVALPMPKGIMKLTEDILKVHDKNPADYLPDTDGAGATDMDQAAKENVVMAKGVPLGPTPLASPQHSKIHSDFVDQNIQDENIREIFNQHIQGELQFQEQIVNQMGGSNGQTGAGVPPPVGAVGGGGAGSPRGVQ